MPTPTLYGQQPKTALFGDIPHERRRPQVDLLNITDRMLQTDPETGLPDGEKRARSVAFCSATVEMLPVLTWAELEQQSRLAERSTEVQLGMGRIEELGRFPEEPYALKVMPSGVQRARNVVVAHEKSKAEFRSELQRRVEQSLDGEVMLYVHGFNETFSTAAYTTAELCHFLGREHACAFFTWPASASGGFLRSYTRTTESAEYAVGHLTKTIRLIAQTPGVKGLQLLAHSRGTAVLLSALCELAIQSIAAGLEPVDVQKIDNVVLLPPDIDADVARQKIELFGSDQDLISRWSAARLPRLFRERLTIYASPTDRALLFSTVLFSSRKRVGALSLEDIPQAARDYFCKWGNIDLRITRQSHRSVRSLLLRQQPGGERRLDSADPPWPYTGRNWATAHSHGRLHLEVSVTLCLPEHRCPVFM